MKNIGYIAPAIECMEIEVEGIICASGGSGGHVSAPGSAADTGYGGRL